MLPSRDAVVAFARRHVWPPYTSSEDHERRDPLVIVEAEGPWLTDMDGSRYLDGNGSWWVSNLGHRHPRLVAALARQAEKLCHCAMGSMVNTEAVLLATELVAIAPEGLTRVFFSDDGSTSVEVAIKMAVQYWRQNGRPERVRFVSLAGAYHGDTVGVMSVGGLDSFTEAYRPLLFDVVRTPSIRDPHGFEHAVAFIEELLRERAEEIAGVIVEPLLQGAAGMRVWDAALLRRLRDATARADTFLIADEVFTGYGRTGPMWACEHAGVSPDILCTAKGFGGGVLPFAATLATDRIFDGFRGGIGRALMHGHSFTGHALGAAVAREVLAIYRDERILERAHAKSELIREIFTRIARIEGTSHPRVLGMMGAIEVGEPGYEGEIGWRVFEAARRRGVYLRPLGNTVYVVPPLNISDADLNRLLSVVGDSIREALSAPTG
jgi:adenosylmethionine-8-amino-7-oxononanoate aminotransferase